MTSASVRNQARLVQGVLVFFSLLMARALLTRRETVSDDAWISMRYAANLVEGHGLLWNPGQPPVEGYSNLLWVLLGALGIAAGAPVPVWLKVLGVGLSMATVPLVYGCVRAAGGSRPAALFGAGLTAVSSQISGTALIGLETPSLTLLMTLGTWRALVEEAEIRAGRSAAPWSALCFGLLSIAHIEGPLYLAVPLLIRASRQALPVTVPTVGPVDRRRDWIAAGLLLVFPVGQELLRLFYYDDWMPNTVRVKTLGSGAHTSIVLGLRYVTLSIVENKALALLSGVGVLALLRRRHVSREDRLAGLALVLPWLCCVLFSVAAKGDMINRFRFLAPGFPTLMAATALGWGRLVTRAPGPLSLAILCAPLGLGVVAAHRELSIQMVMHNRQSISNGEGAIRSLLTEAGQPIGDVQVMPRPISRLWLGERGRPVDAVPWFIAWVLENVPPGDTVMFPDVGLLGYALSDGGVLDARGLNSRGPTALLAASPAEGPEGMQDPGVLAFLDEFYAVSPCCLVLQTSDGVVWGPPEAALQGAGAVSAYRGVATGRYSSASVRVYTADRSLPSASVVQARYRRMIQAAPGEYDWASRLAELESGAARPAEYGMDPEDVQLYPAGSWYHSATLPPSGGR